MYLMYIKYVKLISINTGKFLVCHVIEADAQEEMRSVLAENKLVPIIFLA